VGSIFSLCQVIYYKNKQMTQKKKLTLNNTENNCDVSKIQRTKDKTTKKKEKSFFQFSFSTLINLTNSLSLSLCILFSSSLICNVTLFSLNIATFIPQLQHCPSRLVRFPFFSLFCLCFFLNLVHCIVNIFS